MPDPVYSAAPADTLRVVPLDAFTAIYHRASGITHLVASPVPEILAALGPDGMTLPALTAQLVERYDLLDADGAALRARLDELVAAGLARIA
ncbi:HPr-rel-A system PqqD family peptide chaperone [Sphingomonas sp. H39-1-10]|uniref:HPr-rel-A system PqqD family peptide chaperone n=1 Tax=Sphingomonas pollutisoli TaxID=3030829 RepID=UPI0023B88DD1|nr:HPr-rel-A system PqqD family peptide chaperone [Sphingomonas pollutisoli]MDF0488791.1 HPr-rel-A system PqqD family peptide chaperone [Sphingomonas pollutisoli]